MSTTVFSICIAKSLPIDWREVKQIFYQRFPDDEAPDVDVVPYKADHSLAGHVKIFVHLQPQSDAAVKMRDYLLADNRRQWKVTGPTRSVDHLGAPCEAYDEVWWCGASRVARRERKPKEAAASAAEVEYEEPYPGAPVVPPPPPSLPPSPLPSPPSCTAPCGARPPPLDLHLPPSEF